MEIQSLTKLPTSVKGGLCKEYFAKRESTLEDFPGRPKNFETQNLIQDLSGINFYLQSSDSLKCLRTTEFLDLIRRVFDLNCFSQS